MCLYLAVLVVVLDLVLVLVVVVVVVATVVIVVVFSNRDKELRLRKELCSLGVTQCVVNSKWTTVAAAMWRLWYCLIDYATHVASRVLLTHTCFILTVYITIMPVVVHMFYCFTLLPFS